MAKNDSDKGRNILASLFEDLTHLQIDTIIKTGMISSQPPDRMEELLYDLHNTYVQKLKIIIDRNELDFPFDTTDCKSYSDLDIQLKGLQQYMDDKDKRIEEQDYVLYQRMITFCRLIEYKSKEYPLKNQSDKSIYSINLLEYESFDFEDSISIRDKARFKRFHDLGMEKIVMQTRFGIDGDVVTRIEEGFANKPREVLVDIHEKHIRLSTDYWNGLINTVVNFIGNISKRLPWFK